MNCDEAHNTCMAPQQPWNKDDTPVRVIKRLKRGLRPGEAIARIQAKEEARGWKKNSGKPQYVWPEVTETVLGTLLCTEYAGAD